MSDRATGNEMITSPQESYDSLQGVSPESPCPYLPGRRSRFEAYLADVLDGGVYENLMAAGFRRGGRMVYRPRCRGCQECRQLRVLVAPFHRSRSMRRTWRRNADLRVEMGKPEPTTEKFDVYRRYLDDQHDGLMCRSHDEFIKFLYDSPIHGIEFRYLLGKKLIGASIADVCPHGLSSVYMYFDPVFKRRSLGTFSVLFEIEHCRRLGLPYYYLGYYVAASPSMAYKARFRPSEVLVGCDRWIRFRD